MNDLNSKRKKYYGSLIVVLVLGLIVALTYGLKVSKNEEKVSHFDGGGLHISVHLEPEEETLQLLSNWENLIHLVDLADEYEMVLSLHFSPQMAEYVLMDEMRLEKVRLWEANGHELGFHHHGLSHLTWDGYSNLSGASKVPGYLGEMEDLMNLVNGLSVDGQVTVGSSTDEEKDWPNGVSYGSKGGSPPSPEDLISIPESRILNGESVRFLMKAPVGVEHGNLNANIEDIILALETADSHEYIGLALTDNTLTDSDFQALEVIFETFLEWGVKSRGLEELLFSE